MKQQREIKNWKQREREREREMGRNWPIRPTFVGSFRAAGDETDVTADENMMELILRAKKKHEITKEKSFSLTQDLLKSVSKSSNHRWRKTRSSIAKEKWFGTTKSEMKATEKEERVGWGGLGPNCMQMRAPNRSGAGHANEAPPPVEYLVLFCLFVFFYWVFFMANHRRWSGSFGGSVRFFFWNGLFDD